MNPNPAGGPPGGSSASATGSIPATGGQRRADGEAQAGSTVAGSLANAAASVAVGATVLTVRAGVGVYRAHQWYTANEPDEQRRARELRDANHREWKRQNPVFVCTFLMQDPEEEERDLERQHDLDVQEYTEQQSRYNRAIFKTFMTKPKRPEPPHHVREREKRKYQVDYATYEQAPWYMRARGRPEAPWYMTRDEQMAAEEGRYGAAEAQPQAKAAAPPPAGDQDINRHDHVHNDPPAAAPRPKAAATTARGPKQTTADTPARASAAANPAAPACRLHQHRGGPPAGTSPWSDLHLLPTGVQPLPSPGGADLARGGLAAWLGAASRTGESNLPAWEVEALDSFWMQFRYGVSGYLGAASPGRLIFTNKFRRAF